MDFLTKWMISTLNYNELLWENCRVFVCYSPRVQQVRDVWGTGLARRVLPVCQMRLWARRQRLLRVAHVGTREPTRTALLRMRQLKGAHFVMAGHPMYPIIFYTHSHDALGQKSESPESWFLVQSPIYKYLFSEKLVSSKGHSYTRTVWFPLLLIMVLSLLVSYLWRLYLRVSLNAFAFLLVF